MTQLSRAEAAELLQVLYEHATDSEAWGPVKAKLLAIATTAPTAPAALSSRPDLLGVLDGYALAGRMR